VQDATPELSFCSYVAGRGCFVHQMRHACPHLSTPPSRPPPRPPPPSSSPRTPPPKPSPQHPMPLNCHCPGIETCTPLGLATMKARMPPRLPGSDSPWAGYLRAVYGTLPEVGFDLTRLEAFYTAWLPVRGEVCERSGGPLPNPSAECSQPTCASWFPRTVDIAAVEREAANRPLVRLRAGSRGHAVILQRESAYRTGTSSDEWEEVLRHATPSPDHPEGTNGYGCWFYPAVGSGVWVNVGSTRVWPSRTEAIRSAIGRDRRPGRSSIEKETAIVRNAVDEGRQSVQLLNSVAGVFTQNGAPLSELILMYDACMRGAQQLLTACVPAVVPLRGGFRADRPCECDLQQPVLNCEM